MDLDLARRRLEQVPMSESASDLAEALREAQRVIEAANDPNRPLRFAQRLRRRFGSTGRTAAGRS